MKLLRATLIALVVIGVMLSSGCTKTWSIDFTDDKGGYSTLTGAEPPDINTGGDYGLILSGKTIMADYGFTGNVEYLVEFSLDVSTLNTLQKMDIYLGDGSDPAAQFLKARFQLVGDSSLEYYAMFDNGYTIHDAIYIPGTVNGGLNTVRIVVEDGLVSFYINNATLFENHNIVNYSAPLFVPYVFVQQGSPEEGEELVILKSLKVKYSGDKLELPILP